MKLFDYSLVNKSTKREYSEPTFNFLNRSSDEKYVNTRKLLENWYEHYPDNEKADLRSRFRSSNDIQHEAAFFELYLHEMLLRLNCRVTLHPNLEKTTKKPDFKVKTNEHKYFYLEATIVKGETTKETASRKREKIFYDVLNRKVNSPDYFLSIILKRSTETSPSASEIAETLNYHLRNLDYDELVKNYTKGGLSNLPRWMFDKSGWQIEIQPIPKLTKRGEIGARPIGLISSESCWVDNWTSIRESIKKKGKEYDNLDLPFVIAVNVHDAADKEDIQQALFGQEEQIIVSKNNIESSNQISLINRNDVWLGTNGLKYTRISAVLIVTGLSIFNLPGANIKLYHNPNAKLPYKSILTTLDQVVLGDGEIRIIPGKKADEIFVDQNKH